MAKRELQGGDWLPRVARLTKRKQEETRVLILELLDTDVFHVSVENCLAFLDPLIQSWDIDMSSFGMDVVLNRKLTRSPVKRLEFCEVEPEQPVENAALEEFLKDRRMSAGVTEEEMAFLRRLRVEGRRPSALYYYRELQNLRDPLHFVAAGGKGQGALQNR